MFLYNFLFLKSIALTASAMHVLLFFSKKKKKKKKEEKEKEKEKEKENTVVTLFLNVFSLD